MHFADDVMQRGTTVGNGATLTMGVKVGNRVLFRDCFATGLEVAYADCAMRNSPNGEKREYGKGVLTWGGALDGSADTIVRNVKRSTNSNLKIDWLSTDRHQVYCAPLLDVIGPLLQPTFVTKSAGLTIDATHFGQTLDFDLAAGSLTVNLTAIATLGHGFKCRVWGYNHASNVITLVPAGGEIINEQLADAPLAVSPQILKTLEINDTRSRWRIY